MTTRRRRPPTRWPTTTPEERRRVITRERLILDDGGSLATAASVQTLRSAARDPELWARVAARVKEQIAWPLAQMRALGGTRDDLFAALLVAFEVLAHPRNRTLATTLSPFDLLRQDLDRSLRHLEDERARPDHGPRHANRAKTAAASQRVAGYRARIAARGPGQTKIAILQRIAKDEGVKVEVILNRIKRHQQTARRTPPQK